MECLQGQLREKEERKGAIERGVYYGKIARRILNDLTYLLISTEGHMFGRVPRLDGRSLADALVLSLRMFHWLCHSTSLETLKLCLVAVGR